MFSGISCVAPLTCKSLKSMAQRIKNSQNAAAVLVDGEWLPHIVAVSCHKEGDLRLWLIRVLHGVVKHVGAPYLTEGTYTEVVALLLHLLGDGAVDEEASTCLLAVCLCIEGGAAAQFVAAGGPEVLAAVLTSGHGENVVKEALVCMRSLVAAGGAEEEEGYAPLLLPRVRAVYVAMAAHPTSASVQRWALEVLSTLGDGLAETGGECVAAVRAAMDAHPSVCAVQQCGCVLVGSLRGFLSPGGAVKLILRAMVSDPGSCVTQSDACDALTDLAAGGSLADECSYVLRACGKRVRAAMAAHSCEYVQASGFLTLDAIGQLPEDAVLPSFSADEEAVPDNEAPPPSKRTCCLPPPVPR